MIYLNIPYITWILGKVEVKSSFFQGLRRGEQSNLLEIYRARIPLSSILGNSSSQNVTQAAPDQESSRIRKLEKLIKKRL